jgi:hypothetical protein
LYLSEADSNASAAGTASAADTTGTVNE